VTRSKAQFYDSIIQCPFF